MSRIENALEKAVRRREPSPPAEPRAKDNGGPAAEPLKTTSPYIIRFAEQDAPITEEYRKLRSLVLMMTKKPQGDQNVIMVTSSESGEGKSLTAINLALVLAQEYNHTVLLVDADLRRPMLHTYLGLEPIPGLSDCLVDNIDVGRVISKTGMPNLSFLASGKRTNKPAELLSSNKMKALMHEVKNRYQDRYIIVDTPPALLFSETHVISSYVDGILFVVKEGVAAGSVRAALDVLKEGPLMGIVFNDANPQHLNGRYHRYYEYYNRNYQQGNGSDSRKG